MPAPSARPDRDLVTLFTKALRALGDTGHPDAASKLAAQAWWGLKDTDPRGAQRINGTMHYLARLPDEEADGGGAGDAHRAAGAAGTPAGAAGSPAGDVPAADVPAADVPASGGRTRKTD